MHAGSWPAPCFSTFSHVLSQLVSQFFRPLHFFINPRFSLFSFVSSDDVCSGGGCQFVVLAFVTFAVLFPMSKDKYRGDTPPSAYSYGMSHWKDRGYRGMDEDIRPGQTEDPKGEEAYQRCFAEAARMKPPRVPNAAFFENSPSAMEYLRKRDRQLFSQTGASFDPEQRQRNPNFVPPPKDARRATRGSLSPTGPTLQSVVSSGSQAAAQPPITVARNIKIEGQPSTPTMQPADVNQRFVDPQYYQGQAPAPSVMEPTFGPTGPGRMLR